MSTVVEPAGAISTRTITWSAREGLAAEDHYRVAAFPADYALTDDVILRDEAGRAYLLSNSDEQLLPIEEDTANSLGMFFEPSQDSSWHTIEELRRIIYGVEDVAVTVH